MRPCQLQLLSVTLTENEWWQRHFFCCYQSWDFSRLKESSDNLVYISSGSLIGIVIISLIWSWSVACYRKCWLLEGRAIALEGETRQSPDTCYRTFNNVLCIKFFRIDIEWGRWLHVLRLYNKQHGKVAAEQEKPWIILFAWWISLSVK